MKHLELASRALGLLLLAAFAAVAQDEEQGTRRALLIGINNYKSDRIPNLMGALNDIERMGRVLTTRYGFDAKYIRFVRDEQATREGLLKELKRFVGEVGKKDVVYIHYSGHGSQVADKNSDEKDDGKDETLVPQDGRTPGIADITDDELALILKKLPTENVVVILDSCHSGTATRSTEVRARAIPEDTRADLYPDTTGRGIVAVSDRCVLFTGAAAHERALDGPCDGQYHGLFTYAFSRSLANAPVAASARTVMRGIEGELSRLQNQLSLMSMPEPQLEAPEPWLDLPLFPSPRSVRPEQRSMEPMTASSARCPWAKVVRLRDSSAYVKLEAAAFIGGSKGSEWAIYPPGEEEFVPGRALNRAKVVDVKGRDSLAMLVPANALVTTGARAVLLSSATTRRDIPIRFGDVEAARRKAMEQALTAAGGEVKFVGPQDYARFVVDYREGAWSVCGATGDEPLTYFRGASEQDAAKGFVRVFCRSQAAAELMALDNPGSSMRVDARVVTDQPQWRTAEVSPKSVRVVPNVNGNGYRIRRPGEPATPQNSLMLEVTASQDCFLTIVDVDSQGGVNLLFPNPYQAQGFYPEGRVPGRRPIRIPDAIGAGSRCGFQWDIAPPGGTDSVRVFATSDLQTARMIREFVQQAAPPAGGQFQTYRGLERLQDLMDKMREEVLTRAVHVVPGSAAGGQPPAHQPSGQQPPYQPQGHHPPGQQPPPPPPGHQPPYQPPGQQPGQQPYPQPPPPPPDWQQQPQPEQWPPAGPQGQQPPQGWQEPQPQPGQQPQGDWTATTVTFQIVG